MMLTETMSLCGILMSLRKVRLKLFCVLICMASPCLARNHPPQFLINGQTEIVVRLKEGPETPVGNYRFCFQ